MKKTFIAAILCLSVVGCIGKVDTSKLGVDGISLPNFNTSESSVKDVRGLFGKIDSSLKDASKEECLLLAKMYLGLAEYLKHATGITTTQQIAPPGLVTAIAKDYGWNPGKYPTFTAVIDEDMESELKVSEPKNIDDSLRAKMIECFSVYGEGCRRAASNKR